MTSPSTQPLGTRSAATRAEDLVPSRQTTAPDRRAAFDRAAYDDQRQPTDAMPEAPRGPTFAHGAAMICAAAVALAAVVRVAIHSTRGFRLDQRLMESLGGSGSAWSSIVEVLQTVSVVSIGCALALCVGIALARRRWALATGAVVLVVGANLTTQVLKRHVLESVAGTHSMPSGHTTVGLSVALAAVLVSPRALRPLVTAVAALVATFVGAGTVAAHWHRPADVVAAAAVCLGWAGVATLIGGCGARRTRRLTARQPGSSGAHLLAAAVLGAAVAGCVFVGLGVRPALGSTDLLPAALSLTVLGAVCAAVVGWVATVAERRLG